MEEVTQLLTIEIDQKAVDKAIDKTLESKKAIQELLKEREKLDLSTEKGSRALLKNEASVKALNDTIRQNSNVLKANEKAQNANTGSITEMREQLKIVSKQWADLSKEERENEEIGGKLAKQKKELTDV